MVLDHDVELAAGGVFVPGCVLPFGTECELIAGELVLEARVVFVDERGAGLELVHPEQIEHLERPAPREFDEHGNALPSYSYNPSAGTDRPPGLLHEPLNNLHAFLRGLSLVEQVRRAQRGQITERILLERIYGKAVWEPLLRNPRITGPEVARIARMGALPRPMIELICSNGAWLQIPEIRRALLSNPRLGTDQILRVLRLLPKPELRVAASATAYPHPVRDAAKRLLRELDGRVK